MPNVNATQVALQGTTDTYQAAAEDAAEEGAAENLGIGQIAYQTFKTQEQWSMASRSAGLMGAVTQGWSDASRKAGPQ